MIQLLQNHLDEIRSHGERDYPYECCGLLLGHLFEHSKVVSEIYPISNAREEAAKRNRFLITPEEILTGDKYAAQQGLEIIGFYHSHPDHPAVPSQYDLDHALPVYSYVVVSVRSGQAAELRSWEMEIDRSQFNQEEIMKSNQALKGT